MRTVCERVMQLATFDLRDLNAGFLTFPVVDLAKNTSAITFRISWRHAVASLDRCQIEIWTELSAVAKTQTLSLCRLLTFSACRYNNNNT